MVKKVIFVCSANYYRSRYAEHYFNWLAGRGTTGLEGRFARSDGGGLGQYRQHLAAHARCPPVAGNSSLVDETREPKPLTIADGPSRSRRGRPGSRAPRLDGRAGSRSGPTSSSIGGVDDLDCAHAHEALPHLEEQVHGLLERLRLRVTRKTGPAVVRKLAVTRVPGRQGELPTEIAASGPTNPDD